MNMASVSLLAAEIEEISKYFREQITNPGVFYVVLTIAALTALSFLLYYFIAPFVQRRKEMGRIFSSLCKEHDLSQDEARKLRELASQHGISNPSRLFVREDWFDERFRKGSGDEQEMENLREKLFGK